LAKLAFTDGWMNILGTDDGNTVLSKMTSNTDRDAHSSISANDLYA